MGIHKNFRASLHGHSQYSDGLTTVYELTKTAYQHRISYLALTDHNSVAGIPELYQAADHFNKKGHHKILPIAGIELLTDVGEILMLKPATYTNAIDFLSWCHHLLIQPSLPEIISTVRQAIDDYQAFVVVPHPQLIFYGMHSITFENIQRLHKALSPSTRLGLGLEIHNWSGRFLFSINAHRENHVHILARNLKLAQMGGSDYHDAWQIPSQMSIVPGTQPTYTAFIQAFRNRTIHPAHATNQNISNTIKLYKTLALAWNKSRMLNNSKRKHHKLAF